MKAPSLFAALLAGSCLSTLAHASVGPSLNDSDNRNFSPNLSDLSSAATPVDTRLRSRRRSRHPPATLQTWKLRGAHRLVAPTLSLHPPVVHTTIYTRIHRSATSAAFLPEQPNTFTRSPASTHFPDELDSSAPSSSAPTSSTPSANASMSTTTNAPGPPPPPSISSPPPKISSNPSPPSPTKKTPSKPTNASASAAVSSSNSTTPPPSAVKPSTSATASTTPSPAKPASSPNSNSTSDSDHRYRPLFPKSSLVLLFLCAFPPPSPPPNN